MHDGDACFPAPVHQFNRIGEHVVGLHDPFDAVMKHAAGGGEVVLVFDQHNSCRFWIHWILDLAPVVSCFEGFAANSMVSLSRSASPMPATPAAFKKMRRLLLVPLMTPAWSSIAFPLLLTMDVPSTLFGQAKL